MSIKRKLLGFVGALAVGFATTAGVGAADAAEAPPHWDVAVGDGYLGSADITIDTRTKTDALNAVRSWRQDALDTNVPWPDANSETTMSQYLANNNISVEDYLNPQWSYELHVIATQRAVEQRDHTLFHLRTNGDFGPSLVVNGIKSWAEVVAWGSRDVTGAIAQWATEKHDYIEQTGGVTGHYTFLINPTMKSYGFSGFTGQGSDFGSTWVGEGRRDMPSNDSELQLNGTYKFPLALNQDKVDQGYSPQSLTIIASETNPLPEITYNYYDITAEGTWTSENPDVATVADDGTFTGVTPGETTFYLSGNGHSLPVTVSVVEDAIDNVTPPSAISVESGTAPVLPKTVQATMLSGTVVDAPVAWEEISPEKYSAREGGTFTVTGTVEGWSEPVTLDVRVKPAQIISFGYSPHTVSTDSGVEPELPPTGSAVWSNGDTTNEPIIWEANDRYMDREGGTYTVTGTVDGWASSVKVTVTVNPASVRDTTTPEVTTTVGTEPVLPDTVKVTWTNGDTTDEPVTWDLPPAETWDDSDLVGETLSVTGKLTNYGQDVAANVTVEAAPAEEPGTEEPGTEEPGTEEPGTEQPGTEKPGTEEPGTEKPGTEKPGTEKPGSDEKPDTAVKTPAKDRSGGTPAGDGKPKGGAGPSLPLTGVDAGAMAGTGLMLLLAGATALAASRRNRLN